MLTRLGANSQALLQYLPHRIAIVAARAGAFTFQRAIAEALRPASIQARIQNSTHSLRDKTHAARAIGVVTLNRRDHVPSVRATIGGLLKIALS
jgi:hypothetical protein